MFSRVRSNKWLGAYALLVGVPCGAILVALKVGARLSAVRLETSSRQIAI